MGLPERKGDAHNGVQPVLPDFLGEPPALGPQGMSVDRVPDHQGYAVRAAAEGRAAHYFHRIGDEDGFGVACSEGFHESEFLQVFGIGRLPEGELSVDGQHLFRLLPEAASGHFLEIVPEGVELPRQDAHAGGLLVAAEGEQMLRYLGEAGVEVETGNGSA